jgi:N-acetyl-anhydromuramyl-L-alanine amidase AmpD
MPKHVLLFEGWLQDIATFFTGVDSTKSSTKDLHDQLEEFEDSIIDISDRADQPNMSTQLKKDKYFVVHHTAGHGKAEDIVNVLNNRGLGVQWIIDREGKVFKSFPDGIIAWHAGHSDQRSAPTDLQNDTAQGVEVIAKNDEDVLPIQVVAAFKLIKWLGYDRDSVWGHGEVTYNKEATEGKTIVDYWRENWEKTPEEAELDILGAPSAKV